MSSSSRQLSGADWALSILFHLLLLAPVLWFSATAPVSTPPPIALELWAGGASPAISQPVPPAPVPLAPPPEPVAPAAPEPVTPPVAIADAQIKLKANVKPPKPHVKPAPEPVAKPVIKPEKPEAKPAAKTEPKLAAKPTATPALSTPPAKTDTKKPSPAAPRDDLLADLDLPPGPGTAKQTQRGSAQGVVGGSSNGVEDARARYAQTVSNRVRPYVGIPDGLKGNPEVILQIDILPSLEVRSIKLLRSSGNNQYDEAVQQAVRDMRRFPPLPKGAEFADYRRVTMTFRPKE